MSARKELVCWLTPRMAGYPRSVEVDERGLDVVVTVVDDAGYQHTAILDQHEYVDCESPGLIFHDVVVAVALLRMKRERV